MDEYARHWRPLGRAAVIAITLVAFGVVAAACGGGSTSLGVASVGPTTTTVSASAGGDSSSQSGSNQAQLLKYSQCMRTHGITSFPDPTGQGNIEFKAGSGLNPNSSQFETAQKACQSLMPGALITPAEKAAANTKALEFAQCMRAHGVANFPDPNGQGVIEITRTTNLAVNSPQYDKAQSTCQSLSSGFDIMMQGGPGPGGAKGNSGS